MHPIRKIYKTLHLCEEISKVKYGLVCHALLTSFRTFNGGVVRRVCCGKKNSFNYHETPPVKRVHFDVEFPFLTTEEGYYGFNPSGKHRNSTGLIHHQSVYSC